MRILMVTLAYEPAFAFGGPVKVVQNNSRELVRRGHHVTVYCTNRIDKRHKISARTVERKDQAVRVVYHNTWFIARWPGSFGLSFSLDMLSYLLREGRQFDLIHINEARAYTTVVVGLYAQAAHIPYIIQAHGSFIYGYRHQHLKKLYDLLVGRRIYHKAARVIALTSEEILECEAVGVNREKIAILSNGIDLSTWKVDKESGLRFRKQWGIPANVPLVLFLSRIDKMKGPDLLGEALAQLKMQDVYCIFVGPDDGYLEYTQKLAVTLGLSNKVIFTEGLKGDDVKAAYAAADIFALPSRFDTFPMSIVEALASGIPVLTTDTCQISALIQDKAGVVVPVDSVAISDGLRQLLQPDVMEAYARGARELAEREFSIQRTVDRLEEIYKQVLQESNYP